MLSQGLRAVVESRYARRHARDPINGAVADGVTPCGDAFQEWLDGSKSNLLSRGVYFIEKACTVRSGQNIEGLGWGNSIIIKGDFAGPVFLGRDVEHVSIGGIEFRGPGRTVGVGNKAIDIAIASNEICPRLTFYDLYFTEFNDVPLFVGTGSFCIYDGLRTFNNGFASFLIEGGDGHTFFGCTTRFDLNGYYIRRASGFGPTSISILGSYAEQSGRGMVFEGAHSVTIAGGGIEAPINFDPTHPGICLDIGDATTGLTVFGLMSRLDTIGAAIAAPIVRVRDASQRINVLNIERYLHATGAWNPNPEMLVEAGCDVWLGQHNFTTGRVTHNSSIKIPTMTTMT